MNLNRPFLSLIILSAVVTILYTKKTSYARDLDFIYHQLKDNHPGMYNKLDPTFKENLNYAYQQAQKQIAQTTDKTKQRHILNDFTKSFNDTHLRIHWNNNDFQPAKSNPTQLFSANLIEPNIAWVTLPTFFALSNEQLESLEALQKELPLFREKSALVFDLRGNPGGNSAYAQQIFYALFGKQYAQYQIDIASQNTFVDWRASKENLAHVLDLYKQYGYDLFKIVAEGMRKSIEQNKPYYRQQVETTVVDNPVNNPVSAQIFVIIDHTNVSSALRFIDYVYMMEHPVTLIGKTTKADRLYSEVRMVELPSKEGLLIFPIKVFRNRTRGDNIPYQPDFEVDTANTKKLELCIVDIISKGQ